jgi:hypothetical protein
MPTKFIQYGDQIQFIQWEKEAEKSRRGKARIRITKDGIPFYGRRRADSLRRTKTILVRRVLCALEEYGSPILLTLTFSDQKSQGSHDVWVASKALRRFFLRLRVLYPQSATIAVPELSPKYRLHYHCLLFGVPLSVADKRVARFRVSGSERSTRILAKAWGYGFVDAIGTDGNSRLAGYLAKYFTKASLEPLFYGSRLIRTTKNFPRPYVHKGPLAEELMRRYNKHTPIFKASSVTPWMGRMEIRKYNIS